MSFAKLKRHNMTDSILVHDNKISMHVLLRIILQVTISVPDTYC